MSKVQDKNGKKCLTSTLTDTAAVLLDDFTELRDANEADDPEVDICPFPA